MKHKMNGWDRTGYYGITSVEGCYWKRYHLRDARAAERFYRRPPEGRIVSVGYRRYYRTLPMTTGWTLIGTGADAQLRTHGAQDVFTVPAWARKAGKGVL